MDQEVRAEFEKMHGRVNDLKERVVNLEAQSPHINAALTRIEKGVDRTNGHLIKAVWIVLAMFFAALWKMATSGMIPGV